MNEWVTSCGLGGQDRKRRNRRAVAVAGQECEEDRVDFLYELAVAAGRVREGLCLPGGKLD